MPTEIHAVEPGAPSTAAIAAAARALDAGGLVAVPTDTLYGVIASADRPDALERLAALREPSTGGGLTVHVARRDDAAKYVPNLSTLGRRFIRKGWPGPLTLTFPVPDPKEAIVYSMLGPDGAAAVYADGAVSLRWADHAVLDALLIANGRPVLAAAAGGPGADATSADAVRERLNGRVDVLLDGGPTRHRKGSTIVRVNGAGYAIVRVGVFDDRTIRRLATTQVLFVCTGNTCRSPMAEAIFREMLAKRLGCPGEELADRGFVIRSAGTFGGVGGRASHYAIEICHQRGIDLSGHRSRGLRAEDINTADYIFTMGRHHRDAVLSIAPDAVGKCHPLDPDAEIADPMGGSIDEYEQVARQITRALERRIDEVAA